MAYLLSYTLNTHILCLNICSKVQPQIVGGKRWSVSSVWWELLYSHRWKLALLQQVIWFSIFNYQHNSLMSGDSNYIYNITFTLITFSWKVLFLNGASGICQSWVLSNWSCLGYFKRTKVRHIVTAKATKLCCTRLVHMNQFTCKLKLGTVNAIRLLNAPQTGIPLKEHGSNIADKQTLKIK